MAKPQGRARTLVTLFLSTRRLSVLRHVEVASLAAASPLLLALRAAGAVSAFGAYGPFKSYTSRAAV